MSEQALLRQIAELQREHKRLREALEKIADGRRPLHAQSIAIAALSKEPQR